MAEALKLKSRYSEGNRIRKVNEYQWEFPRVDGNSVGAGLAPARLKQMHKKIKTGRVSRALGQSRLIKSVGMVVTLLAMLLLIIYAGLILRIFDPTAGVPDIGILAILLLALFSAILFYQIARWLADQLFTGMLGMDQSQRILAFKTMQPWQQIGLYMACFTSLFWGCIVVLTVMM